MASSDEAPEGELHAPHALGLVALGGKAAPPELAGALAGVRELPAPLRERFAEMLVPTLEPLAEDQLDGRIVRLARRADLPPERMAPPIKATRFLFRAAAANDAAPADLKSDLDALLGDAASAVAEVLLPLYEQALPELRKELVLGALRAHGCVLSGIEWRIDTIGSTNAGRRLGVPVALVTLHYQDRREEKSFTLQLLPDMVAALRDVCNELLST